MESAALLEPLSVGIHATRRAQIEQGDTVIVFGAGTVGLLTAAMAKVSGATTVVIADIDCGRINYALANGFANKGYIVTQAQANEGAEQFAAAKELAADIMQIASLNEVDFEGADVTFDCTGKEVCMQAGLYVSNPSKFPRIPTYQITLGNQAGWKAHHGRHGHSDTDTPHVGIALEGSRHYRHLPLCQHVSHRHQDLVCRCAPKS